ncbi:conserved protein of unknown function [Methanocaldococcus lauensis]|nr:conserved protein of unknown function [Methanocaldococcus lauensis]
MFGDIIMNNVNNVNVEKILEDLKIINSKARYMGIKIVLVRHIIEPHINNEKIMHKILKSTENSELYNLILLSCPKLKYSLKK